MAKVGKKNGVDLAVRKLTCLLDGQLKRALLPQMEYGQSKRSRIIHFNPSVPAIFLTDTDMKTFQLETSN
ncbi:hypothetical protein DSO57_1024909 [Entomophthora muscae]|uniref:Uncharacterized protein n=1 Tax=Entomophthora muscae TaxID=34485 RepID=A0ACC2T2M8_9FUNG|nr:hypothetical protein DSO57_1024909 [Entomophthora muscae]